jgi:hypothetical protein
MDDEFIDEDPPQGGDGSGNHDDTDDDIMPSLMHRIPNDGDDNDDDDDGGYDDLPQLGVPVAAAAPILRRSERVKARDNTTPEAIDNEQSIDNEEEIDSEQAAIDNEQSIDNEEQILFEIIGPADHFVLSSAINSDPNTPANDEAAFQDPLWREGTYDEYDNFLVRDGWELHSRTTIPKGKKPLKVKNVYKLKAHAITNAPRHKVRTVCKGFAQIPGVNFTESYSPVAMDSSIRSVLGASMHMNEQEGKESWVVETVDVEAAFLEGDLEHLVYIEFIKDFEEATGRSLRHYATPGAPGTTLLKNQEDIVRQDDYRKYIGKLMWAIKKVMPAATNAIRDLSSHLDNPGKDHWKALIRLVGYIKGSSRFLRLRAPRELRVESAADSDWASDKEDRKSISGYITTIGGCLVNWSSRKQDCVTLSSTEAEVVAAAAATTDMIHVQQLLGEIFPIAQLRKMLLREDNMGAIFIIKNQSIGQRTKHIDIRLRFMNDLVIEGKLAVEHIASADNPCDPQTKNVTEALHSKHDASVSMGMIDLSVADNQEDVERVSHSRLDCPTTDGGWTEVSRKRVRFKDA